MAIEAYVPGSVTVIFVPQDGERSLGVSFATDDGARITVERAPETIVYLDGEQAEVEPVAGVLQRLDVSATVRLETDVPIGCGFGVSGAATLGTALAANALHDLELDRDTLLEKAHRAEVEAGTGLGDVFIQDRGGLVWDRGAGMRRAARTDPIAYESFGGVATSDVLGDAGAMERVTTAGEEALRGVDPTGPLSNLIKASWTFADETNLATDWVHTAVERVQKSGGVATMAMIGETVIGTGEASDELTHTTRITPTGARLLG